MLRAYPTHDDPLTGVTNVIAIVVGLNGPVYPIYVWGLVGPSVFPTALLTMLATPFFLAIPALSRRSPSAARLALPLVGTLNTVWCIKLFGPATLVGIFLLPCMVLAALLARPADRRYLWLGAGLPYLAEFIPDRLFGDPLLKLGAAHVAALAALNITGVASLSVLIAFQFAQLLRQNGPE